MINVKQSFQIVTKVSPQMAASIDHVSIGGGSEIMMTPPVTSNMNNFQDLEMKQTVPVIQKTQQQPPVKPKEEAPDEVIKTLMKVDLRSAT